ncbi:MAG TPA: ABC transporter permease [Thermoanaerobaculia bacterium]|nr:ABC transporter permease [Thermoanaerobaculia bacterium]
MLSLWQEIRQAARRLAGMPSLVFAILLCTGLGVGAASAAWSVIDAVLLRPLPYSAPDRLVMVWERALDGSAERIVASLANVADWRQRSSSFERLAAFSVWFPSLTGVEPPEKLLGAMVSADFFPALGVVPLHGRTFLREEDRPGAAAVVLLSHGLWQRRFGGDPGAVGRTVTLDGVPHTIVGVMPAGFRHPEPLYLDETTAVWKPLALDPAAVPRAQRFLRVLGRLRPGISLGRAQAEMDVVARRMAAEHPDENAGMGVEVVPLAEQLAGEVRRPLWLLLAAAALVLLIACANVASLLLADATGRRRETALRAALGAGRGRLVRQALIESLLPALAGGALGLLAGSWDARVLFAAAPRLPGAPEVGLDPRGLAFALAASLLCAVLAGLAPALAMARSDPAGVLGEGGSRTGGLRGGRLLPLLVLIEVALSLPLLIGAGLLSRSLARLADTPLGFSADGVLTARIELPPASYAGADELRAFYDRLLPRLAAVPGVRAAGTTSGLPLSGLFDITRAVGFEGSDDTVEAGYRVVSPGYFAALGIPLSRGRLPGGADGPQAPPVVLVNESFARAAWPGREAVGNQLVLQGASGAVSREVIGVVGDVRHEGPAAASRPEIFVPLSQTPTRFATLAVRTAGAPEALAGPVRAAVREVDRNLALAGVQPMSRVVTAALARPRFQRMLAGALAVVALALAAAGLYGVTAYSAGRQSREIGIRMALGAGRPRVLLGVLRRALAPVVAGLALGLAASLLLARFLAELLYEVAPTDPLVFFAAPLVLLGIALAAAFFPARRAAQTDPGIALRAE